MMDDPSLSLSLSPSSSSSSHPLSVIQASLSSSACHPETFSLQPKIDENGGGVHVILSPPSKNSYGNANGDKEDKIKDDDEDDTTTCKTINSSAQTRTQIDIDTDTDTDIHDSTRSGIKRGDEILSCPALSIALDPIQRRLRCGYCARKIVAVRAEAGEVEVELDTEAETKTETEAKKNNTTRGIKFCKDCCLVSFCNDCNPNTSNDDDNAHAHADTSANTNVYKWHKESGECQWLSCLVDAYYKLHMKLNEKDTTTATTTASDPAALPVVSISREEIANQVNSLHLLTARIMIRRWYDECKENNIHIDTSKYNHTQASTTKTYSSATKNHSYDTGSHMIPNKLSCSSPFPHAQWTLFDEIYAANDTSTNTNTSSNIISNDTNTEYSDDGDDTGCHQYAIVKLMRGRFLKLVSTDSDKNNGKLYNRLSEREFDTVMRKVIGCSHAITDITAPLGCQSIGRALFLQHSFYNHSCAPNAFLSFSIPNDEKDGASSSSLSIVHKKAMRNGHSSCVLMAHLHCIKTTINFGESINISYIPTSGLASKERQQQLYQCYGFHCNCDMCRCERQPFNTLEDRVRLPPQSDADILRQMQFSCNEKLLELEKVLRPRMYEREHRINNECILGDDQHDKKCGSREQAIIQVQNCISTIHMNQRGITNQGIPKFHETAIESHRLLAFAFSLSGESELAIEQHELFVEAVLSIKEIYDPVALATSLLEYARDLGRIAKYDEQLSKLEAAHGYAKSSLGNNHRFVKAIKEERDAFHADKCRSTKRQKVK